MQTKYIVAISAQQQSESNFKELTDLLKFDRPGFNQIFSLTFKFSFTYENNFDYHTLLCILFAQIQQQIELMQFRSSKIIDSSFKLLADFIRYCQENNEMKNDDNTLSFLMFVSDQLCSEYTNKDTMTFQKRVMVKFFSLTFNIEKSNQNYCSVENSLWQRYQISMKQLKKDQLNQLLPRGNGSFDYIFVDQQETYTLLFPSTIGIDPLLSKQSMQLLNETPGNNNVSYQHQQQYQQNYQTHYETPYQTPESMDIERSLAQNQINQHPQQGSSNSRCIDCDRPVDINFKENGQPPNRCVNCFEEYLADNF